MTRSTRFLAMLLAMLMVLSALPAMAAACTHPKVKISYTDSPRLYKPTCIDEGLGKYTCTQCNATWIDDVPPTGKHDYKWKTTTEPTCTKKGKETGTCKVCGETKTRSVDTVPHQYENWKVVKEPTCTEKGKEQAVCKVCGDKQTRSLDKSAHDFEYAIQTAATDHSAGILTRTCRNCKYEDEEKYYPKDTWKRKDKGTLGIYVMQQLLHDLGYLAGEPDGIFGKNTEAAVKAFQADAGLEVSGIGYPETQQMIYEYYIWSFGEEVNIADKSWLGGLTSTVDLKAESYDRLGDWTHRTWYDILGTTFSRNGESLYYYHLYYRMNQAIEPCEMNAENVCIHCGFKAETPSVIFLDPHNDLQLAVLPTNAAGHISGELPDASKYGCKLAGWYYEREGITPVSIDDYFAEDTTVYAKWEADETVLPNDDDLIELLFVMPNGDEYAWYVDNQGLIGWPDYLDKEYNILGWYVLEEDLDAVDSPDGRVEQGTKFTRPVKVYCDWKHYDIERIDLLNAPVGKVGTPVNDFRDSLNDVTVSASEHYYVADASVCVLDVFGSWVPFQSGKVGPNNVIRVEYSVETEDGYAFAPDVSAMVNGAWVPCNGSRTAVSVYHYMLNGSAMSIDQTGTTGSMHVLLMTLPNFHYENGYTFIPCRSRPQGTQEEIESAGYSWPICPYDEYEVITCQWYVKKRGANQYTALPYARSSVDTGSTYRIGIIVRCEDMVPEDGYWGILTFGDCVTSALGTTRTGNFLNLGDSNYICFNFELDPYDNGAMSMDDVHTRVAEMPEDERPMDDPAITAALERWLSESGFDDVTVKQIVDTLSDADELYQKLYLLLAGTVTFEHIDPLAERQTSRYTSSDNVIHLKDKSKYENDSYFLTTFFHESGHAVDDLAVPNTINHNGDPIYLYMTSNTMRDDLFSALKTGSERSVGGQVQAGTSAQDRNAITKAIIGPNYRTEKDKGVYTYHNPDFDEPLLGNYQTARDKTKEIYDTIYRDKHALIATDVGAGMTNLTVRTNFGHIDDTYWYSGSSPTYAQCDEAWAEYFSARVRNAYDELKADRTVFPEAMDLMEEIANTMLEALIEQEAAK